MKRILKMILEVLMYIVISILFFALYGTIILALALTVGFGPS